MTDQTAHLDGFDPRDEPLPFLSNFQDIFLSIGVFILLIGIAIVSFQISSGLNIDAFQPLFIAYAGITGVVFTICWVMSEIIVRSRRRILPGIVLFATMTVLAMFVYFFLYGGIFGEATVNQFESIADGNVPGVDQEGLTNEAMREVVNTFRDSVPMSVKAFFLGFPIVGTIFSFIYYRRFKLPFSSAVTGAQFFSLIVMILLIMFPFDVIRWSPTVGLLFGLGLLFGGIHYDMKDPERVSRFSGNGFWFHFFAAPTLLSSVLMITSIGFAFDFEAMAAGEFDQFTNKYSVAQSVVTLVVIAAFALISLLLNRRALVVSGLISAGTAIGIIVNATGLGTASVAAVTLILLGGGILLLGLGWHAARRALLKLVPSSGFWGRLFPRTDADG